MTTTSSRIRLLLCAASAVLVLTWTVAAFVLPRPIVGADPGTVAGPVVGATGATGSVRNDPCDLIVGPARDFCREDALEDAAPVEATASSGSRARERSLALLLFSTAAVAAAIGVAVMAGRRPGR